MKIPEKWYVVRDYKNSEILNAWENKTRPDSNPFLSSKAYFFPDKQYCSNGSEIEGYTEISFEDFKKYILEENKEQMNKQIIAYKLKKEMPLIPSGEEFKLVENNWTYTYEDGSTDFYTQEQINSLPDWFEPVFKEKYKIGDFIQHPRRGVAKISDIRGTIIKLKDGWSSDVGSDRFILGSLVDDKTTVITEREFEELSTITIGGYPMKIFKEDQTVSFGCQIFSKDEIEGYLGLLNRSEIDATITIKGESITQDLLIKIIEKLK